MFLSSTRCLALLCVVAAVRAQGFSTFPNVLELSEDFDPVDTQSNSTTTGGHRITPFAVSFPEGDKMHVFFFCFF
jgi:hypothetical protein